MYFRLSFVGKKKIFKSEDNKKMLLSWPLRYFTIRIRVTLLQNDSLNFKEIIYIRKHLTFPQNGIIGFIKKSIKVVFYRKIFSLIDYSYINIRNN